MLKNIFCLAVLLGSLYSCTTPPKKIKVPVQKNQYVNIYSPKPDTFPGPSTSELQQGRLYKQWVPNDHTFVKDKSGDWHIFGITHPLTSTKNIHQGEFMAFHAKGNLTDSVTENSFTDLPKVLTPATRKGERLELYAPFIIERENAYYMTYSPSPMRLAVSTNLNNWTTHGILFKDKKGARDPNVFFHAGKYHIIYCTERNVALRTSVDFKSWSTSKIIYTAKDFEPESPSIIIKDQGFYLFVCGWNGVWDRKSVSGAYQHRTYVYYSESINEFNNKNFVTILNAHAPEIFKTGKQWYVSSAEYPYRGISIDKLEWK